MHKDTDGYTSVREAIDPMQAITVLEFAKVSGHLLCVPVCFMIASCVVACSAGGVFVIEMEREASLLR